jgi:hypothetical protein
MNRRAFDIATAGLQVALAVGMIAAWFVLITYLMPPLLAAAEQRGAIVPGIVVLALGAARYWWLIAVALVAVVAGLLRGSSADERGPRVALLAAVLNVLLTGSFVLVAGAMLAHTFRYLR